MPEVEFIRDVAVKRVEGRRGYAFEHASDPDAMREDFDAEYRRLARSPVFVLATSRRKAALGAREVGLVSPADWRHLVRPSDVPGLVPLDSIVLRVQPFVYEEMSATMAAEAHDVYKTLLRRGFQFEEVEI